MLDVIYLIFNEGYSATAGDDWTRPALCEEALRLGRILAGLQPDEPEVHGLLALMELQASRLAARTGPDGEPVLLADQDRRRWDRLLIRRGLAALDRAEDLGGGPYTLQAADRRLPRPGRRGRGHRLARGSPPSTRSRPPRPLAGRRPQPRRRGRHGRRTGAGPTAAPR